MPAGDERAPRAAGRPRRCPGAFRRFDARQFGERPSSVGRQDEAHLSARRPVPTTGSAARDCRSSRRRGFPSKKISSTPPPCAAKQAAFRRAGGVGGDDGRRRSRVAFRRRRRRRRRPRAAQRMAVITYRRRAASSPSARTALKNARGVDGRRGKVHVELEVRLVPAHRKPPHRRHPSPCIASWSASARAEGRLELVEGRSAAGRRRLPHRPALVLHAAQGVAPRPARAVEELQVLDRRACELPAEDQRVAPSPEAGEGPEPRQVPRLEEDHELRPPRTAPSRPRDRAGPPSSRSSGRSPCPRPASARPGATAGRRFPRRTFSGAADARTSPGRGPRGR